MVIDYNKYMDSHQFKNAQIQCLGEALEDSIEENVRLENKYKEAVKQNQDIVESIKELADSNEFVEIKSLQKELSKLIGDNNATDIINA